MNTRIADFKVRRELGARLDALKRNVRDDKLTVSFAGAPVVRQRQNVCLTIDDAIALLNALADTYASVLCRVHQNDLTAGAGDVEGLELTKLTAYQLRFCNA